NNSAGVVLRTSLAVQNNLSLSAGLLSSNNSSTITFGANTGTLTINIGVSAGTSAGGRIDPSLAVAAYNLTGMTYNVNYYILTPSASYTTGVELPPSTF